MNDFPTLPLGLSDARVLLGFFWSANSTFGSALLGSCEEREMDMDLRIQLRTGKEPEEKSDEEAAKMGLSMGRQAHAMPTQGSTIAQRMGEALCPGREGQSEF